MQFLYQKIYLFLKNKNQKTNVSTSLKLTHLTILASGSLFIQTRYSSRLKGLIMQYSLAQNMQGIKWFNIQNQKQL